MQTLGRMEFLLRFNPEGVEQGFCSELYTLNISVSESQNEIGIGVLFGIGLRNRDGRGNLGVRVDSRSTCSATPIPVPIPGMVPNPPAAADRVPLPRAGLGA